MRYIVTGGAGFIGSHLCRSLIDKGHDVLNIDNFCDFYPLSYKLDNVRRSLGIKEKSNTLEELSRQADKAKGYKLHISDIRDYEAMDSIFSDFRPHGVFHLAAMAGVRPSIEDPRLYNQVNITGTLNILEASAKNDVSKVVIASSSSVYGNCPEAPFREDMNVDRPISPYASTKKSVEVLAHVYHSLFGIDTALLRYFTVYGPGQRPDLAIHKFTRLMMEDSPITLFGDGTMERDYTYIDDIVDGTVRSMGHIKKGSGIYEIFNLGESRTVSLNELVSLLQEVTGIKARIIWEKEQPGDVKRTYADISHSKKTMGYSPDTPIEKGLKIFTEWCREYYGM